MRTTSQEARSGRLAPLISKRARSIAIALLLASCPFTKGCICVDSLLNVLRMYEEEQKPARREYDYDALARKKAGAAEEAKDEAATAASDAERYGWCRESPLQLAGTDPDAAQQAVMDAQAAADTAKAAWERAKTLAVATMIGPPAQRALDVRRFEDAMADAKTARDEAVAARDRASAACGGEQAYERYAELRAKLAELGAATDEDLRLLAPFLMDHEWISGEAVERQAERPVERARRGPARAGGGADGYEPPEDEIGEEPE